MNEEELWKKRAAKNFFNNVLQPLLVLSIVANNIVTVFDQVENKNVAEMLWQ